MRTASAVKTAAEIVNTEPHKYSRPLETTADVPLHNALAIEMGFELQVMDAPPVVLGPDAHLTPAHAA